MKSSGKLNVLVKAIVCVCAIAVLAGILGFVARYTNNFTSEFKTLYVKFGDKTIMEDTKGVYIEQNREHRFDVGYSLGFLNKDNNNDFRVRIVPNTEFEYTVDGKTYLYSKIEDLTECFTVQLHDGYFTLTEEKDLPDMIQTLYVSKVVTGVPRALDSGKDYFLLEISNPDKSMKIRIAFNLITRHLTLSRDTITF